MAIEAAIVDEARALLAAGGLRLEPID